MSRIQAEAEWPQNIKDKIKKTFKIIEAIKKNPRDNPIEAIQKAIRHLTYAFFKNGLYLSQPEMGNISHNNQTLSELVNSHSQISSFSNIWTVKKQIYAAKKWLKHELKRTSEPDQTPFVTIFSSPELQRLKVILYGIRNTILAYQENKEYYRPDNVPLFTGFNLANHLKKTEFPQYKTERIFNAVSQLVNQYQTNDTLTEDEIKKTPLFKTLQFINKKKYHENEDQQPNDEITRAITICTLIFIKDNGLHKLSACFPIIYLQRSPLSELELLRRTINVQYARVRPSEKTEDSVKDLYGRIIHELSYCTSKNDHIKIVTKLLCELQRLEINNIIQNREERLGYELLDTELEQSPLYIILEAISVYNSTQNLAAKKELAAGNNKEEIITIFKNSGKSIITEVITTREDINVGLKNFEKEVTEAHEHLVAACFDDSTTESDLADRVHELQTLYIEACACAATPSGSNTAVYAGRLFDNPVNRDSSDADESDHCTKGTPECAPRYEG